MGKNISEELYDLYNSKKYENFIDLIKDINNTSVNKSMLTDLIKIDYFSEFGNPNQLLKMVDEVKELMDKFESVELAVEEAVKKLKFVAKGVKLPEEFYYSQIFMLRILDANVFELDEIMTKQENDYLVSYLTGFSASIKELI
jgi:DNA polymerase III alpha subunit